jgi:hypothetical protein
MPRERRPKTGTERSRKSREISALKRDMKLIDEMLGSPALSDPNNLRWRNALESFHRKKFNRLQILEGPYVTASGEWKYSNRISRRDCILRPDGLHDNESLIDMGFISGSAGTLNSAGAMFDECPRFRTPDWMFDPTLLQLFRDKLREHRPKTAEKDLLALVAYYLCYRSDQEIFAQYYAHPNHGQFHRGWLRRDKNGGYTNLQSYRLRLVNLGYVWLGLRIPTGKDWAARRHALEQAIEAEKQKMSFRAVDPIAFEKGEGPSRFEPEQGEVNQRDALAIDREEEQRRLDFIDPRTRDRRREKARQGLSQAVAARDRHFTLVNNLLRAGNLEQLHKLLVPAVAPAQAPVSEPSPVPMRVEMQRPELEKAA